MSDSSKNDDWTRDARFNHFWLNYHKGQSWYDKHQIAYWRSKAVAVSYENSFLYWLLQTPVELEKQSNSAISSTLVQEEEPTQHQNLANGEEIEMEISSDMLEFIAHSMKHKRERDGDETNPKQVPTYINIDEIPIERTLSNSKSNLQSISHQTSEDYTQLYGVNASRIQAMETAIQLNFNRNCDRKQPKLWPNMPLKM